MTEPFYLALWQDILAHVQNDFVLPRSLDDLKPWAWLFSAVVSIIGFTIWARPKVVFTYRTSLLAWKLPFEIQGYNSYAAILEDAISILRHPAHGVAVHNSETIVQAALRIGRGLATMIVGVIPDLPWPFSLLCILVGIVMVVSTARYVEIRASSLALAITSPTLSEYADYKSRKTNWATRVTERAAFRATWPLSLGLARSVKSIERIASAYDDLVDALGATYPNLLATEGTPSNSRLSP